MKLKGSLQQAGNSVTFNDGATSAAVLQTTNSAAATFSLPSSTDTLVGRASVDTLTNKTIDAGSNTLTGIANAAISGSAAIAYSKLTLTGSVVNADISASAAIAYSKLALTGSVVNADVSASAAIAYSKLNLAASVVNADIATGAAIAYAKLALTGAVVNADISSSAAIAYSKLALTGSVVAGDLASGFLLTSTKGGTGVNNAGTLTYGANNVTLTTSGVTTLTLPTTGTLATLAGAETLSFKTLTAPVISSITNVGTLTLPSGPDTLVGTSASQTLSNKQIGSGNSVSGASASSFNNAGANILLPSTADTLVGRATTDTLTNKTLTAPVISSIVNTGTLTLPTSTDTLVGRATTDTLTNKTLTTPTLTTPVQGSYEDWTETTTPSSPGASKLRMYAKSDDKLYLLNSTGVETAVGAGAGEKNYVTGTSTSSGWAASGAGITVGTTTSGLPRPNTSGTGILLTGVSGSTAYAYFRFILDDADAGKKLKVQFDMKPGTAVASDFKVDVYSNTANDYTTGNARLPLSTDSSSVSALPALTGTYRTTFDAPAITAKYIEVRIGLNQASVHTLVVSDLVVGPGVVTQGAARSSDTTYSLTVGGAGSNPTLGTNTQEAAYSIDGEELILRYDLKQTSAGTAGSGVYTFSIPSGYTLAIPTPVGSGNGNGLGVVGDCQIWDGTNTYNGTVQIYDSTRLFLTVGSQASFITFASSSISFAGTNMRVSLRARVRVSERIGSGTVNVGYGDGGMYAYNSSTSTTTDTTNFGYGPGGIAFTAMAPTGVNAVTKRVRFPAPVQGLPVLQTDGAVTGAPWVAVADRFGTFGSNAGGTAAWGYRVQPVTGSTTDFDVNFYATFDQGSTDTWSVLSGFKWRLFAANPGQAVGFGTVVPGVSSGLVSAAGVPGNTTGNAIATGYVGEVIERKVTSGTNAAATGAWLDLLSAGGQLALTLNAGVWRLSCVAYRGKNAATLSGDNEVCIATATASTTGTTFGYDYVETDDVLNNSMYVIPCKIVTISATTTYYMNVLATYSAGTPVWRGSITAQRIG